MNFLGYFTLIFYGIENEYEFANEKENKAFNSIELNIYDERETVRTAELIYVDQNRTLAGRSASIRLKGACE